MSVGSVNRSQFNSRLPGELGVCAQHFDCEVHFVSDSLSRTMPAAEKFQVRDGVIAPIAIDVMNGFLGEKLAAEMLGHHKAMLQNFVLFAGDVGRNGEPDISVAFDVTLEVSFCEPRRRLRFAPLHVAGLIAESLLSIVNRPTRSLVSFHRVDFAALFAGKHRPFLGVLSSAECRARNRAVRRVFAELPSVFREIAGFHRERFAALFAVEPERWLARPGFSPMNCFVRGLTGSLAKALSGMRRLHREGLAALLARFLNPRHLRHGGFPYLGGWDDAMTGCFCQAE